MLNDHYLIKDSPINPTELSQAVSKISNSGINTHIDTKHTVPSSRASVHCSNINWALFSLRQW